MAIPENEIERVKAQVSLADVVRSRGVELKKKGRQLWGLCPFHAEDEPSFAVDERKGLWNCLEAVLKIKKGLICEASNES